MARGRRWRRLDEAAVAEVTLSLAPSLRATVPLADAAAVLGSTAREVELVAAASSLLVVDEDSGTLWADWPLRELVEPVA